MAKRASEAKEPRERAERAKPRARDGAGEPGGHSPSVNADDLMPLVYAELRRLAAHYLRGERPGQTLQPTALVHEAYLKLLKDRPERWQNRAHFCAIAAHAMRQILIERARARGALKRGGNQPRITFDEGLNASASESPIDMVALDAALDRLAALDAGQARIVELRFFGGLSIEETADAMEISPATVKRHWAVARAWLAKELESDQ
jgi:RNA polymerase sigma factor (TIGR02999 family)